MNKSKFLKKSLAMILAVMMIVAMIPLGASAATDLTVSEFTVNNKGATIADGKITATSTSTRVDLGVRVAPNVDVTWTDKDGNPTKFVDNAGFQVANNVDLTTEAKRNGNVYTLTITTSVGQSYDDAPVPKNYTLEITYKPSADSNDATLARVNTIVEGAYESVSGVIDNDKRTVVITMPFGCPAPTIKADGSDFVTTSSAATKSYAAPELTVVAGNGTTRVYNVSVVNEKGFTEFSLPDQAKSEIEPDKGEAVTVTMPYGADMTTDPIPATFKVGENILKVTTTATYGDPAVVSGETELTFTAGTATADNYVYTTTVYLWTSETVSKAVTVTVNVPKKNPACLLTSVKVAKSNTVELGKDATSASVEMPAGFFSGATNDVTVVLGVSKGAKVEIPTQGLKLDDSAAQTGKVTFTNGVNGVNVSDKKFTVRVTAEDGKSYKDYPITLTQVAVAEAKITDFAIKNNKNTYDVKSGNVVITEPTANTGTITVTVPYIMNDDDTRNSYKVYLQTSTGAKITKGATFVDPLDNGNGDSLKAWIDDTDLPAIGATGTFELRVTSSDPGTWRTYTVVIKAAAPKTHREITAAKVVDTNDNALITSDGTYKVDLYKAGEGKRTIGGAGVDALEVAIPYSYADTHSYFQTLTLSEGAKAYVETGIGGAVAEITALDPEKKDAQAVTDLGALAVCTVNAAGAITGTPKAIYVLSEQYAVNVTLTKSAMDTLVGNNSATKYNVYGVKDEALHDSYLFGFASTLDTKVKASHENKDAQNVTITVPYSYAGADAAHSTQFSAHFDVSPQAKLQVKTAAVYTDVTSDQGNETKAKTASKFYVKNDGNLYLYVDGATGDKKVEAFRVMAEDGKNHTPYNVVVSIAEAKTEAKLLSVKVGSASAVITGNTATITLPYGAKLNPVKLAITASEMATVKIGGVEYSATKNYDLNSPLTIVVTSENGKTSNQYKLSAKIGTKFTDIKDTDWFYGEVMQAAAIGFIHGYEDGTFRPNNSILRKDFAVMVAQWHGATEAELAAYKTAAFKDVADDYAMPYINYCKDAGIISGDAAGTFRPNDRITRQEVASVLDRALKLTVSSNKPFNDDAKIASWAKTAASHCKAANIFAGDEKGNFNPTNNITRAEAAAVLVRSAK